MEIGGRNDSHIDSSYAYSHTTYSYCIQTLKLPTTARKAETTRKATKYGNKEAGGRGIKVQGADIELGFRNEYAKKCGPFGGNEGIAVSQ